jgi:hypothetical protein
MASKTKKKIKEKKGLGIREVNVGIALGGGGGLGLITFSGITFLTKSSTLRFVASKCRTAGYIFMHDNEPRC